MQDDIDADRHLSPAAGEETFETTVRFRTVGDVTCTGCVESTAATVEQVIAEEHVPGRLSASTCATGSNVVRHPSLVTMRDRCSRGATIWFTGFSGSGKSTVAMLVEQQLLAEGRPAFVLDGDNLRHGLNADLGFSLADRAENLRRLAHVAALIAASGQVVLVPAISPLREHRELAQRGAPRGRSGLRVRLRGHPAGGLRAA